MPDNDDQDQNTYQYEQEQLKKLMQGSPDETDEQKRKDEADKQEQEKEEQTKEETAKLIQKAEELIRAMSQATEGKDNEASQAKEQLAALSAELPQPVAQEVEEEEEAEEENEEEAALEQRAKSGAFLNASMQMREDIYGKNGGDFGPPESKEDESYARPSQSRRPDDDEEAEQKNQSRRSPSPGGA